MFGGNLLVVDGVMCRGALRVHVLCGVGCVFVPHMRPSVNSCSVKPFYCCLIRTPLLSSFGALQEASVRGQLYMDTFRRLNLALVLQTGATLVVAAQAVSLRNNLLTGAGSVVGARERWFVDVLW